MCQMENLQPLHKIDPKKMHTRSVEQKTHYTLSRSLYVQWQIIEIVAKVTSNVFYHFHYFHQRFSLHLLWCERECVCIVFTSVATFIRSRYHFHSLLLSIFVFRHPFLTHFAFIPLMPLTFS